MASEQFASLINGKKIAASAALPGSTLAKQLEGIADGAYRVVTLTDDEHPVPDVEKPSHKLLYLTKDEYPSLLDAYTEWIYHENEWIIVGSTALNPENYKLKQEAKADPSTSGNTENFQFISTITQNANGEITATKHTIPKSDAINYDSSDTLATSKAVKSAIDSLNGTVQASSTNVSVSVTETAGKLTGITVTDTAATSDHVHGEINNDGTIGETADLAVVTGESGAVTVADLSTAAPVASGTDTAFVTTVSQDSKGKITVAKANLPEATTEHAGIVLLVDSYESNSTKMAPTANALKAAYEHSSQVIADLDVTNHLGNGQYITDLSQTDGKIAYGVADMAIQPVQGDMKPITSGGVQVAILAEQNARVAFDTKIDSYLPEAVSPSNKLADKAYVDAIGERIEARYLSGSSSGEPFATYDDFHDAWNTNNFYYIGQKVFAQNNDVTVISSDRTHTDEHGRPTTTRWHYTAEKTEQGVWVGVWCFEYIINNSALSQEQLDAINSGITPTKRSDYDNHVYNLAPVPDGQGNIHYEHQDHMNPHGTTYTQTMQAESGLDTTAAELQKLHGATITTAELNTLTGISTENGSTVQKQLDSKANRVTGTANHIVIVSDTADQIYDTTGTRDIKDSGAIITPYYESEDTVNPATGSAIKQAIDSLDDNDDVVHHQFVTTVGVANGKISVTRAQPIIGDIDGLTEALVDIGTDKANKVEDAISGNLAGLDENGDLTDSGIAASNVKLKQNAVPSPEASGNSLSFIDTIEQNANGEITATKKTVPLQTDYTNGNKEVDNVPVTASAVTDALETLDSSVAATGATASIQVSIGQVDGKLSSLTVDDSAVATTAYVDGKINDLDVEAVGGEKKYIVSIEEVDGKISATPGNIAETITESSDAPASSKAVYNKIAGLNHSETRPEHNFVSNVTETAGVIDVDFAQPVVSDISGLSDALALKADRDLDAMANDIAVFDANGHPVDAEKHIVDQYRDTEKSGDAQTAEFAGNIPTGKAVKELVDESVSSTVADLDAEVTSTDGTNVQVKVTEVDGVITAVNVTTDNTVNQGDVNSAVTGAINTLNAEATSIDGTNVQVKVTEVEGKITAVNVTTDKTVNQGDVDSAVTGAITSLSTNIDVPAGTYITNISETAGVVDITTANMDTTPTVNSTKPVTSGGVKSYVDSAVNALDTTDSVPAGKFVSGIVEENGIVRLSTENMDTTPTAGSTNPVTSGGIKSYVDNSVNSLDYTDLAVEHQFVTGVSETDGVISVSRAQPTVNDISGLADKILEITEGKANKVANATANNLATLSATGDLVDSTKHIVEQYRDTTQQTEEAQKAEYKANVVTGTAVDQAIKEQIDAMDGRLLHAIQDLDAEEVSTDGTNVQVQVTEVDGKITAVNVTTDNTINSADLANRISDLDANLNATGGTNVGLHLVEEDGVVTGLALTDNTINATDLSNAINALDAEKTSNDGKNVQVKVTEVDGKITAVNVTTDSTVNSTDVSTAITGAIEDLDVAQVGGAGKYIKAIKEDDGKITATVENLDVVVTAGSNVAVTSDAVATKISGLNHSENRPANNFVTNVTETAGVIDVDFAQPAFTDISGVASVAQGGTGATSAAGARTNLDVYSTGEVDSRISGHGKFLGKRTPTYINSLDPAVLHNSDSVICSADGTITLGESGSFNVQSGEELILFKDDSVNPNVIYWQSVTGNYKRKQDAIDSTQPAADTFSVLTGLHQNANGEITVDRASLTDATQSLHGLMTANDKTKLDALDTQEQLTAKLAAKADKVTGATAGHLAGLDANGNLTDSGKAVTDNYSATGTDPVTGTAVKKALDTLDSTATSTDGTNVQVKVTETDGKITAVNITTDNTATAAQGVKADNSIRKVKVQSASGTTTLVKDYTDENAVTVDLSGYKPLQTPVSSSTADTGSTLTFVSSVTQNAQGVITPKTKTVTVDSTYSSTGTNPVNGTAIAAALDTLDATVDTTEMNDKIQLEIVQTNGKLVSANWVVCDIASGAQGSKADSAVQVIKLNGSDVIKTPDAETGLQTVNLGNLKTTQTAVEFTGAATKTIDKVTQNANGEVVVTFRDIQSATTSQKGIVQLSSATDSSDESKAATPKAVKTLADGKADKVSGATNGNFAGLDANGNLTDSGKKASDFATSTQGGKADTAIQGVKVNGTELTKDSSNKVNVTAVTGIKGSAQSSYSTGQVTLTAGNVGAYTKGETDTLLNAKEDVSNKKTTIDPTSDTDYPTSKAVATLINSSVATATATHLGTFSVSDIGLSGTPTNAQIATALNGHTWPTGVTPTNNDYVYIEINSDPATTIVAEYRRFKFDGTEWGYEYALNNSSYTQAQWDAINSGITATDKGNYDSHISSTSNPHGVTKAQVGLSNVVNTGDSATPVAGGTTKFTTGGAYTELNKKADKVGTATENNFVSFDANGNIKDSGKKAGDFADASHTHGNISNAGTLTDTAAAATGNDYVVIRDADNAKIQTSTIKGTDVVDAVSKKHSHASLTLSTTAQAYDGSHTLALPSDDPYTSARTPTSHTHGNITNDGKVGSTADRALVTTTGGTVITADLTTAAPTVPSTGTTEALEFIDSVSQDSKGKITATKKKVKIVSTYSGTGTDPVNGTAVKAAIDALDAAKTSTDGTNIQVKVTETDGKITAVNITTDNTASNTHGHGNITNTGAIGTASGQAVYTTTDGVLTAGSLASDSPTASGNTLSFIDTVSQNAKGKITATKKSVTVDSTYSASGTNPANGKAIAAAIATLDVDEVGGAGQYISKIKEVDGKISATVTDMDTTPTTDSTNAITSGGVKSYVDTTLGDYKTKQTAQTNTGSTLKTATAINQNANGELDVTFSDIQSATPSQKGVVQLAGSIGTTVSSENNKAATEKAVRDAINALDVSAVGGSGKYISAISEDNGKISATATTMDSAPVSGSSNAVTSGGIKTELDKKANTDDLAEMNFSGTAGASKTITNLANVDGVFTVTLGNIQIAESQVTNLTNDLAGKASSTHTHGNITNDGKVGTNADYAVVTTTGGTITSVDLTTADPVVPSSGTTTSLSFIDSVSQDSTGKITASKKKVKVVSTYSGTGTDPVNGTAVKAAIDTLNVDSVGGSGKYISAISESNGKISATVTDMDTAPTADSVKAVTSGGVKTYVDTKVGNYKPKQTAVTDPTASGTTITAIDTISQDANGVISATKKTIRSASTSQTGVVQLAGSIGATVSSENNKAATEKAVRDAIDALDVTAITGTACQTITSISETDGKISATYSNISITKSQVSDFSHSHGNITNGGAITATGVSIANGDTFVIADSSASGKLEKASITFDGSTTGEALSKAGTWQEYVLKADEVSYTGGTGVDVTGSGTTRTISANITSIPVSYVAALA